MPSRFGLLNELAVSKGRWAQRSARACGRALALLGPDPAARIKDAIRIIGKLDYPRASIEMVVDSPVQVGRLGACRKEPETVRWLEATFRPGDVLYDVGANVGAYSFVADAVVEGRGLVYAFEPGSATFAALAANILLNRASARIVAFQLALGAHTGLTTLDYSSLRAGAASHRIGGAETSAPERRQTIPSFRLDELVRLFGLKPPTHVKIDVDGGELGVLEGARQTLASGSIRHMLIEIDDADGAGRAVLDLLARHGFEESERHTRLSGRSANVILKARAG
jgi:FkbM family methyltransferase